MIIRFVRVQAIANWLKTNFSSYQTAAPMDGWRQYLTDNGATGGTLHDMESSYLAAKGYTTGKLSERWVQYSAATVAAPDVSANWRQRLQAFFTQTLSASGNYYLTEDSFKYQLEDGSGFYILE